MHWDDLEDGIEYNEYVVKFLCLDTLVCFHICGSFHTFDVFDFVRSSRSDLLVTSWNSILCTFQFCSWPLIRVPISVGGMRMIDQCCIDGDWCYAYVY